MTSPPWTRAARRTSASPLTLANRPPGRSVKNLRMVSTDDLKALTGLDVGAVPPFGHLLGLPTYVDARLLELPRIAFNAGSRTTSVIMAARDLARLARPIIGHFAVDEDH